MARWAVGGRGGEWEVRGRRGQVLERLRARLGLLHPGDSSLAEPPSAGNPAPGGAAPEATEPRGRRVRRRGTLRSGGILARRHVVPAAVLAGVLGGTCLLTTTTSAVFWVSTSNSGNSEGAGSVVLSDDDGGAGIFSMSGSVPGDTQTKCVTVTYSGTLGAQVRLYASAGGTGLGAYMTAKITRGAFGTPPGSGSCTGFTADSVNYASLGAGVLYNGALGSFPTTWAAGTVDPSTTTSPTGEVWTNGEQHAYQIQLTVRNTYSGENLTASPTFTWEARDASTATGSYYANAVLADNPASFWRLNETSGTTATDATGAVNCTYKLGPVLNADGPLNDGAGAASFDGVNDWVDCGDVYNFTARAAFSLELWVNPSRYEPGYNRLISTDDGSTGWQLQMLPSAPTNGISFGRYSGGVQRGLVSATALTPGTWYHVVITYDGTTSRLYINGVADPNTGTDTGSNTGSTRSLAIAADGWGGENGAQARIADVAIYSSALTASQVAAHYNARN
jgi:Concanavalin A-like lectin/glucanases superfamily